MLFEQQDMPELFSLLKFFQDEFRVIHEGDLLRLLTSGSEQAKARKKFADPVET